MVIVTDTLRRLREAAEECVRIPARSVHLYQKVTPNTILKLVAIAEAAEKTVRSKRPTTHSHLWSLDPLFSDELADALAALEGEGIDH